MAAADIDGDGDRKEVDPNNDDDCFLDGEEDINGILKSASPPLPSTGSRPDTDGASIPIDIFGTGGDGAPDLANLSLKKIKKKAMDRVEKEVISYVLDKTGWNRSKATKILKISYKTLLYKIKDLGIEPPKDPEE